MNDSMPGKRGIATNVALIVCSIIGILLLLEMVLRIIGYNPLEEVSALEHRGLRLAPDLVVGGYY
jgi:hypothetical protein